MTWFPAGIVDAGGAAPFTPDSIANLQGWFDAQDDATIIDGIPPDVQSWNDKSSQAHMATQGTAAERPHESSVNSNASLLFDGVDDVLRDNSAGDIVSPPMTIGIVVTPTSIASGTGDVLRLRFGSTSVFRFRKRNTTDMSLSEGSGGATTDITISAVLAVSETRWFIGRARNSGDGLSDILDDQDNSSTASLAAAISDVDDLLIGANADGSNAFTGHIHEIVIYNRFITDTERTSLGNYFNGKWTISP